MIFLKTYPLKNISHLFLSVIILILSSSCGPRITNRHSNGANIICFGASITRGQGADPGFDYPSYLRKMVKLPVINVGIDGNTTKDELIRLEKDVLRQNPKMVIVTQRNNDIRHQMSKEETLANMEAIAEGVHHQGAMMVLVTFDNDEFRQFYGDGFIALSRRKNFLLIQDVFKGYAADPKYMTDPVHPNNEGYRIVAEHIFQGIKNLL